MYTTEDLAMAALDQKKNQQQKKGYEIVWKTNLIWLYSEENKYEFNEEIISYHPRTIDGCALDSV